MREDGEREEGGEGGWDEGGREEQCVYLRSASGEMEPGLAMYKQDINKAFVLRYNTENQVNS